jgi:RNA polymerase sigma-70 factor, ECF subfamily
MSRPQGTAYPMAGFFPPSGDPGVEAEGTDVGLVRRIAAGDRVALAQLYGLHGQVLLSQINLVVGAPALSEEILQDTMLAVWRGAGSFRGESRVRSWLIAIARRQARDRMRRHRFRVVDDAALAEVPGAEPGPEILALGRAELAEVTSAIGLLAPAHREVLGLAFGAGLTLREVAQILELPLGTVKTRLRAARAALSSAVAAKGQLR